MLWACIIQCVLFAKTFNIMQCLIHNSTLLCIISYCPLFLNSFVLHNCIYSVRTVNKRSVVLYSVSKYNVFLWIYRWPRTPLHWGRKETAILKPVMCNKLSAATPKLWRSATVSPRVQFCTATEQHATLKLRTIPKQSQMPPKVKIILGYYYLQKQPSSL